MPVDLPPQQPNYAIVREADEKKYAEEQRRLRKKEEEDRRKHVDALNYQKKSQTQQPR